MSHFTSFFLNFKSSVLIKRAIFLLNAKKHVFKKINFLRCGVLPACVKSGLMLTQEHVCYCLQTYFLDQFFRVANRKLF
jgi:hypothetical protein